MASDDTLFADFVRRVRAGDADAAAELVRRYETAIRVAVRVRLTDARLRRQFDSIDVCQSVLASFFVRAAAGQYDLQNPSELAGLLVRMALNKFSNQARRLRRDRRDVRRTTDLDTPAIVAGREAGPERETEMRDLLAALRAGLSDGERALADRRAAGRTWEEIAAELGGQPSTLRKQLDRALKRFAPRLGLVDDAEDADA